MYMMIMLAAYTAGMYKMNRNSWGYRPISYNTQHFICL